MKLDKKFNKKNYLILSLIYIISFLLVFYLVLLYNKSNDYLFKQSSIDNYIKNINGNNYDLIYSNLNNFIVENDTFILYVNFFNNKFYQYEEELYNMISDNNLFNEFICLKLDNNDNSNIINLLVSDFSDDVKTLNEEKIPFFIFFDNGKIKSIIYNNDLNIDYLEEQFNLMGVI